MQVENPYSAEMADARWGVKIGGVFVACENEQEARAKAARLHSSLILQRNIDRQKGFIRDSPTPDTM